MATFAFLRPVLALLAATILAALGACASAPPPPPPRVEQITPLFRDDAFSPPAETPRVEDVFAINAEMKAYIEDGVMRHQRRSTPQKALLAAMSDRDMLKLEYDSARTRTAREAFEARSGNCLSLVVLTAALAEHMLLPVTFQTVEVDDSLSRSQSMLFVAGHVNLVIGERAMNRRLGYGTEASMTVDFLAPEELGRRRVTPISRARVLSMYFNNRAVEVLAGSNDLNQAYAYARTALLQDPGFTSAQITLGVIYQQRGLLEAAEGAYRHVLREQPKNAHALADLATVLDAMGRRDEAAGVKARLAQLETFPPFHFFELGRNAVRRGDFEAGRAYLKKELERDPDYHEVHFWLAVAYGGMGDARSAQRHLKLALANSTTRGDQDIYSAKLNRLQHLVQP